MFAGVRPATTIRRMEDFEVAHVTDPLYRLPDAFHPNADVPVPPFTTRDEHTRFHRALAEHVVEIGRACGGQHLQDVLLAGLVSEQVSQWRVDTPPFPSQTVLRIALRLFFPAPWTPAGLVSAWNAVLGESMHWSIGRDHLGYRSDPDFHATRASDGSWTTEFIERGRPRPDAVLPDDGMMVLYLMEHLSDGLPYPYAYRDTGSERVAPGARAAVAAWARQRTFPVYQRWNAEQS